MEDNTRGCIEWAVEVVHYEIREKVSTKVIKFVGLLEEAVEDAISPGMITDDVVRDIPALLGEDEYA
jgi:hypothetical protein